ncbi:hypothetical protein VNO77_33501 [Canavalia gladiata]|uniref:Uncharacterized protein n=1 Tax=Canavalia gladiata TaxID=3824 RepID=A0AAN9KDF5_CANGL
MKVLADWSEHYVHRKVSLKLKTSLNENAPRHQLVSKRLRIYHRLSSAFTFATRVPSVTVHFRSQESASLITLPKSDASLFPARDFDFHIKNCLVVRRKQQFWVLAAGQEFADLLKNCNRGGWKFNRKKKYDQG